MKIECVKDKLERAISGTERITGKQLPLVVLNSIVISAQDKTIVLRATNLDISVEYTIPAKVDKKGVVAVPGKILLSFIHSLPSTATLSLEVIGNNLHVNTKYTSTIIKTVPSDDFPKFQYIKEGDGVGSFRIQTKTLTDSFRRVAFSAAANDIKPEISSIFLHKRSKEIVFVATDSFRLAEYEVQSNKIEWGSEDVDFALIPNRNSGELIRIFEEEDGDALVYLTKNQLAIKTNSIYLVTRLVDGIFPDLSQVFPKKPTTEVVVLKQDLIQALRVASVFADKFNRVGLKVLPKEKVIETYSRNQDSGESVVRLDATLEGEDVDIQFNARYIIEVLAIIPEDSITLSFSGKERPLVIRGSGNPSFTYLVMPLHT